MERKKPLCVAVLTFGFSVGTTAGGAGQPPARPHPKNWTAPNYKIHGQKLCDEIVAKHPELISVTLHGVPPGLDKVYTRCSRARSRTASGTATTRTTLT